MRTYLFDVWYETDDSFTVEARDEDEAINAAWQEARRMYGRVFDVQLDEELVRFRTAEEE